MILSFEFLQHLKFLFGNILLSIVVLLIKNEINMYTLLNQIKCVDLKVGSQQDYDVKSCRGV